MKAWTAILSLCAILLAGCAATVGQRVHTGMTESQVLAIGGKPAQERKLGSGENAWDYTLQPSGYFTWRVVFGSDGRVREVGNLTTYENSLKIVEGMTEADVAMVMGPSFLREMYWTGNYSLGYRYMDDATFMMLTVLMSKSGKVTGTTWMPDQAIYSTVSGAGVK
jgi:outer membrane protein assembly factor BamE (lipoprotein component of BamABCDE complex)